MAVKYLFTLLLISFIYEGDAAIAKKTYHMPSEKSEQIVESVMKCVSKSDNEGFVLQQIKEGKYTDNIETLEALVCTNVDMGYGYKNGRLNIDKVMHELFADKPVLRDALEECDKDYNTTPAKTFKELLLCFRDRIPFKIML